MKPRTFLYGGAAAYHAHDTIAMIDNAELDVIPTLRRHCEEIKDMVSEKYHVLYEHLSEGDPSSMTVVYVYFNMLQETREMLSTMHKYHATLL